LAQDAESAKPREDTIKPGGRFYQVLQHRRDLKREYRITDIIQRPIDMNAGLQRGEISGLKVHTIQKSEE